MHSWQGPFEIRRHFSEPFGVEAPFKESFQVEKVLNTYS